MFRKLAHVVYLSVTSTRSFSESLWKKQPGQGTALCGTKSNLFNMKISPDSERVEMGVEMWRRVGGGGGRNNQQVTTSECWGFPP